MKNKLVYILEPFTPVRVILVNALRHVAVTVGFSSVRNLQAALDMFPAPQIILAPADISANDQTNLVWMLEDYHLTHPEPIILMYYIKPFNPDKLVSEVEEALEGKEGHLPRERRFFQYEALEDNHRIISSFSLQLLLERFIALVLLVLLSPLLLLITISVMADSSGPVFYRSKRAGQGYRVFTFYKFRTMPEEVTGPAFVKAAALPDPQPEA